jgi:hypothetical protein
MHAGVHKEMAFQVLQDYSNPSLLQLLLKGVAKPDWRMSGKTREQWLMEWMDMPDDRKHSSKMRNDHSYKIEKDRQGKFRIRFIATTRDQATVIARLKYDSRDVKEWKVEEEWRTCALELAKSIHWVIDLSTPPHTVAGWTDGAHSAIEKDFDALWRGWYDKKHVDAGRKQKIGDIYRWAKAFVEGRFARNDALRQAYESGGSIRKKPSDKLGAEVIADVVTNLGAYIAHMDRLINFDVVCKEIP